MGVALRSMEGDGLIANLLPSTPASAAASSTLTSATAVTNRQAAQFVGLGISNASGGGAVLGNGTVNSSATTRIAASVPADSYNSLSAWQPWVVQQVGPSNSAGSTTSKKPGGGTSGNDYKISALSSMLVSSNLGGSIY